MIILICDTCSLPPKDEAVVNETIERIINKTGKGFAAWLKHGRLAVDPDVLVQVLSSTSSAPQPNPQRTVSRDFQESTRVVPVSAADSQGARPKEVPPSSTRTKLKGYKSGYQFYYQHSRVKVFVNIL